MTKPAAMSKMNGLGNEIIIVDMRGRADRITSQAARALNRKQDTTFDQIMAIHDRQNDKADYTLEIRNSDGSLAQACGNGTRCVVEWLYRQGKGTHFTFDTASGPVAANRQEDGLVCVDMGKPRLDWADIPLVQPVADTNHVTFGNTPLQDASVVSMGNPHAVFFIDKAIDTFPLDQYGPALEHDPLFPERVNISIVHVTSPAILTLRTWERGAGLTKACGTAACASVVASHRRGLTGKTVSVTLPGGVLSITLADNSHVIMTGPTEYEFSGWVDPQTGNTQ
ncbi:MAG: Diaminopimelate epimerase [Candidatus Tokpelaia hoelldobleri]|uniref:Diaminopimelate epimerase n=1 Tax=Candidatus Tokpelaia hoelldobleri TaxID=1902579 RepID=A0A1U9JWY2_9HYPH|nr:MAG: Diaminopimelate epimerase [Candidatus Tokpelaia hoelldoblerii]